ncbi:MAG: diadenylate cyclase CdaA [Bacteroidales bacterium]|nr:diadenylate cyclase CdaA [Porphyromonas sp.]MDD6933857.1 diadenylate cyclase CdaA [Bacteroidales bacterium]MDY3102078.1 diadenylate cyclase CdaA [Porphyromonas sp.]
MPLLWLTFSFKDAIDILLVAIFLFYTYRILKSSGSKALFIGLFTFVIIWVLVSQILKMRLMGAILDKIVSVGALTLIIIFQDEIRKFLVGIGSTKRWRAVKRWFTKEARGAESEEKKYVAPVVLACMNLAKKKTGALIAIQHAMDLSNYIHTGEIFRAEINSRLIENIFFKNSPLHDGAMIIADGQIRAAGCILPVSGSDELNKDLGLRHRSALGLSQETDAMVVIVSEERGKISYAFHGEIHQDVSTDELRQALEKNL